MTADKPKSDNSLFSPTLPCLGYSLLSCLFFGSPFFSAHRSLLSI